MLYEDFALIGAVANVNRLMLSITESGDIHGKQGQNFCIMAPGFGPGLLACLKVVFAEVPQGFCGHKARSHLQKARRDFCKRDADWR